jgi:hypothetical protein
MSSSDELDDLGAVDDAEPGVLEPGDVSLLDRHPAEVEILGGQRDLGDVPDLVELHLERVGHHRHRVLEDRGSLVEVLLEVGLRRVVAEGDGLPELG